MYEKSCTKFLVSSVKVLIQWDCCRILKFTAEQLLKTIKILLNCVSARCTKNPGDYSVVKHMGGGGWLEGRSQNPQNIYPKIITLKCQNHTPLNISEMKKAMKNNVRGDFENKSY